MLVILFTRKNLCVYHTSKIHPVLLSRRLGKSTMILSDETLLATSGTESRHILNQGVGSNLGGNVDSCIKYHYLIEIHVVFGNLAQIS